MQEELGVCTRGSSGTDCPKKRDGTFMLDNQNVQTEPVWLYYGIIVLAFYRHVLRARAHQLLDALEIPS